MIAEYHNMEHQDIKRKNVQDEAKKIGHCLCSPMISCPCPFFIDKKLCHCNQETYEICSHKEWIDYNIEKLKFDNRKIHDFLNHLLIRKDRQIVEIKNYPIMRAFNLPAWVTKINPYVFRWFLKRTGRTVKHYRDRIEFWNNDVKVAELEMTNGITPGSFIKF